MDSKGFLVLLAKLFSVLSWPSFAVVCPVYASYQSIKSDCSSRKQQCLTYWVLFSLITILESLLAGLLTRLPFWHYAKGMATIFLVLPYFGGAASVYENFVQPYISKNAVVWKILFNPEAPKSMTSEHNKFADEDERNTVVNRKKEVAKQTIFENGYDCSCKITEQEYQPSYSIKAQKQWSCALCLVSTSSTKCLKDHMKGRKHVSKLQELEREKLAAMTSYKCSFTLKETNGLLMLGNLNEIVKLNLEKCGDFMRPGWCIWKKPQFGWVKLNTDGSVTQENASFGGLLRDYNGNPLCAFVSKALVNDIFLVELWAVWRGLVLAVSLGIKIIWIESDSMSVVKTINRKQTSNPKVSSCLTCILKLLEKFEMYEVSHSWRETNRAADHLSKMVLPRSDVVLWPDDFPVSLCRIIKDDARGRVYYRGKSVTSI